MELILNHGTHEVIRHVKRWDFYKDFGNAFKLLVGAVVLKRDVTYDLRRDARPMIVFEKEMTIPRVGKFNLKGPYVAPSQAL